MNAEAFRQFYEYHFRLNRVLWYFVQQLTDAQFTQEFAYSIGSIRNQVLHLMNVDNGWFSQLQGIEPDDFESADRDAIRAHWDDVEAMMRAYLATVQDHQLLEHPWAEGEDSAMTLWQVLLHVANHGTDHRAQTLRALNELGIETPPQDYVFFLNGEL